MQSDSFIDSGYGAKYFDRVEVSAGTHRIFYSHFNGGEIYPAQGTPFTIAVRVYNASGSLTLTTNKYGTADSKTDGNGGDWCRTAAKAWESFHNYTPTASNNISLGAGQSGWICKQLVNSVNYAYSAFYTGNVEFTVNKACAITVAAFKTESNASNSPSAYGSLPDYVYNGEEKNPRKCYSGYADSYKYTANLTLDVAGIASGSYRIIPACQRSMTNLQINGVNKTTDLVPLTKVAPGTGSAYWNGSTAGDNYNVGNWGYEYNYNFTLTNSSNTAKTIKFYIQTTGKCYSIVKYGSNVRWYKLENASGTNNAWRFISVPIGANESGYSVPFQCYLGTNCTIPMNLMIKADRKSVV